MSEVSNGNLESKAVDSELAVCQTAVSNDGNGEDSTIPKILEVVSLGGPSDTLTQPNQTSPNTSSLLKVSSFKFKTSLAWPELTFSRTIF